MRALWTGSIAFGLVNIPVRLYRASEERELKMHLLHKSDLSPVRYAKVCRHEGKEIPYEEVVRGYEYVKGDYVVLTDEDFKRASPKKTRTIEIFEFVDADEIEPQFYDQPYYLEPEKGAEKPYALLRAALKKSGRVGIGKFVLRTKEVLSSIRPEGNVIMLDKLRYADELRESTDLELPGKEAVVEREVGLALQLIDQLSGHFEPEKYKDTYTKELKAVIKRKAEGKAEPRTVEEPAPATRVRDLMSILEQSLKREKAKAAHVSH